MINFLTKLYPIFDNIKYPQFLIIGAQKAGTTTLYDLLNHYSIFCGSIDKEVGFFTNDLFYNQGKKWYLKQFEQCNHAAIKFEATPFYLYHPDTPKRIFSFNPNMKFIVLLREPATRCYSAWNMYRLFNKTSAQHIFDQFVQYSNASIKNVMSDLLFTDHYPSFKQAVEDDIDRYLSHSSEIEPSFVRRGIYFEQITNYLQYFHLDNFLFLEQRELNSPVILIQKISNFLNLTIEIETIEASISSNIGDYQNKGDEIEATLLLLRDFYRPYNEILFKQIGIHYDWNENV